MLLCAFITQTSTVPHLPRRHEEFSARGYALIMMQKFNFMVVKAPFKYLLWNSHSSRLNDDFWYCSDISTISKLKRKIYSVIKWRFSHCASKLWKPFNSGKNLQLVLLDTRVQLNETLQTTTTKSGTRTTMLAYFTASNATSVLGGLSCHQMTQRAHQVCGILAMGVLKSKK